jgi:elongation factor G
MGANPWPVIEGIRRKLNLNIAAVQIPIGSDSNLKGLVDIINMKAMYFEGKQG